MGGGALWIREGADKRSYEAGIEAIIETNCLSCHDGSNPHLSNLDGFENRNRSGS